MVSFSGDLSGNIDVDLAKVGRRRRVVLGVPQFSGLRALLAGTEMIATVPDYAACALVEGCALRAEDPPFPIDAAQLSMAWSGCMTTTRRSAGCGRGSVSSCRCRWIFRRFSAVFKVLWLRAIRRHFCRSSSHDRILTVANTDSAVFVEPFVGTGHDCNNPAPSPLVSSLRPRPPLVAQEFSS
jgi:hypothetical protein